MTDGFPDASPPNPKEERFRPLADFLHAEVIAVVIMAVVALLGGERLADASGAGMIGLLILVPLVRVAWLGGRWWIRGDRRFALVALFVVAVVFAGFLLSR